MQVLTSFLRIQNLGMSFCIHCCLNTLLLVYIVVSIHCCLNTLLFVYIVVSIHCCLNTLLFVYIVVCGLLYTAVPKSTNIQL